MRQLRDTTTLLLIAMVLALPACSGLQTSDRSDGNGRALSQPSADAADAPATSGTQAVASAADPAQAPVAFAAAPFTAVYSSSLGPLERYYEAHASERGGRCRAPYVDGITNTDIVEETPERLVVEVRYLYRDRINTDSSSSCIGYGVRRFVLAKNGSTMNVQEMSGPTRS